MTIKWGDPAAITLRVAVLVVLLLVNCVAVAQPSVVGDNDPRRELEMSRERLVGLLDSVFGRDGYHVQFSQTRTGPQILLVVDRNFQNDYSEEGLRELISTALGANYPLVLSSMPMVTEPHTHDTPESRRPSLGWLLLGGGVLLIIGLAAGWLLGRRPRQSYKDEVDVRLAELEKLASEDPSRVAQVLRLWLRPSSSAAAESGGMTQRELAAVILLSLPKPVAAGVLQQFLPREIQLVGDIMVRIARVRRTVLRYAVRQFFNDVQEATGFGVKAESDFRGLLESALGEKRTRLVAGAPEIQESIPLLENLRWLEAETLAELVAGEHPQVQAIVVASLDTEKATRLIECLPANVRADVVLRVAELDKLQPAAAEAISELIESKLDKLSNHSNRIPPGRRQAAAILKSVSADWSEALLQDIYQRDQGLALTLQNQMFTMDDLLGLTSEDWKKVQDQLPDDLLARALLGCRPDTREGFLQRMPKTRARMLRPLLKEYAGLGAEPIEQSANDVLYLVRRMAASGDIVLSGELRLASPVTVKAS